MAIPESFDGIWWWVEVPQVVAVLVKKEVSTP
jgi:hypothetical protein